jgi:dihydrofolate synthase / folylpolyglutamate synthase
LLKEQPMLTYYEALRMIFARTDYERQNQPPYPERVWRLSRMEEFLDQLGNPQRAYRSVHIAGTKGKGSTTAMIEAILRAAGYRTGMYTSPHLHTFRERIRLAGELIPEADVVQLVERLAPLYEARPEVTVFEIITALAMLYFAEQCIAWGVFEVGMGGRLDATNVLQPSVSVITSISLDHMKVLGDTIEAIAREKAGIVKPGIPVVAAPQKPEAERVVRSISDERKAALTVVGEDWRWSLLGADQCGQRLAVYRAGNESRPEYPDLFIPLLGAHQLENACTAVVAIEALRAQGVAIDDSALQRGLATVQWPGRMEILGQRPLLVVDGAHNPYSIQKLLEALPAYFQYRRLHVVFGAGVTHNPADLLGLLTPIAYKLYVAQSRHAKATSVAELQVIAASLGREATAATTVGEGLVQALAEAAPDDLVLVTGSLFVVAEARETWGALNGWAPLPADPPGAY